MGGKVVAPVPHDPPFTPCGRIRGGHPTRRAILFLALKTSELDDSAILLIGKPFVLIGASSGSGAERRQASGEAHEGETPARRRPEPCERRPVRLSFPTPRTPPLRENCS